MKPLTYSRHFFNAFWQHKGPTKSLIFRKKSGAAFLAVLLPVAIAVAGPLGRPLSLRAALALRRHKVINVSDGTQQMRLCDTVG